MAACMEGVLEGGRHLREPRDDKRSTLTANVCGMGSGVGEERRVGVLREEEGRAFLQTYVEGVLRRLECLG